MIQATLESTNFTFTAYGQTTSHAVNALKRGLDEHGKQYGLQDGWWKDYSEDIFVKHIELNRAYRDHELLKVPA